LLLAGEIGAAGVVGELCGSDFLKLGLLALLLLVGEPGEPGEALLCSACWFNALMRSLTPIIATPTTV